MSETRSSWRHVFRVVFVLYTCLLVFMTHKPGLTVEGPLIRTDLVIHCGAFFMWTCLLYGSIALGWRGCRDRLLVWVLVAGLGFAVLNESTQPLKPFERQFDWLDLIANCLGVLLAGGFIRVIRPYWEKIRGDVGE